MPFITKPPENLTFISLAELYDQFHALLVGKDFQCPRGKPITIVSHHFFHLVKLQKEVQTQFTVEIEESLIRETTNGLGPYMIDQSRAERLSWIPEILRTPHEIWEPNQKKTAEEIFIREYDKSGSPFRAVLLKIDQDGLRLVTCMPMKRAAAEKLRREGKKLWP
jgi:hypothetical protein